MTTQFALVIINFLLFASKIILLGIIAFVMMLLLIKGKIVQFYNVNVFVRSISMTTHLYISMIVIQVSMILKDKTSHFLRFGS